MTASVRIHNMDGSTGWFSEKNDHVAGISSPASLRYITD
jgi:hypothetical protein